MKQLPVAIAPQFIAGTALAVTERALQALLNGHINLCAHATKISVNIPVGKSQNSQAQSG